jgi:NADH-quinone oxidoreductase subunit J
MNFMQIFFYGLSVLTIFAALMVVLSRNPVHSVLYLILTFFLITAHYVLLNAQFLAIVNIIVYAGAIMVLFLFVLMLLNLNTETEPMKSDFIKLMASIFAGTLLLGIVVAIKVAIPNELPAAVNVNNGMGLVKSLGQVLFSRYVIPFEISSILFLAAMVGAVMIGKRKEADEVLVN